MDQSKIYNDFWKYLEIQKPENWSTWEIVKDFQGKKILELGPGNYPKTPLKNGCFLEISKEAVENLKKLGANAILGDIINLPFENNFFDLAVAIEVLEHIKDDSRAFSEIARVLKPDGFFLFSVPLRMDLFDAFDTAVGHERRYEIENLIFLTSKSGLRILKYRKPSIFSKLINRAARATSLKKTIFKKGLHKNILSSKSIANTYSRLMALSDKKGAPKWKNDIENLKKYKEDSIVIFCQKKNI